MKTSRFDLLLCQQLFHIFLCYRQNWTLKNFLAFLKEKEIIDVVCHGILWHHSHIFLNPFFVFSQTDGEGEYMRTERHRKKIFLMWIKKKVIKLMLVKRIFLTKFAPFLSYTRGKCKVAKFRFIRWHVIGVSRVFLRCWRKNFYSLCGLKSFKFELHCGKMSTCTTNYQCSIHFECSWSIARSWKFKQFH